MGRSAGFLIRVRNVRTDQITQCHASSLYVSTDGDLLLGKDRVELVGDHVPDESGEVEQFTDPEVAEQIVKLGAKLNSEMAVMEPREIYHRAIIGVTNTPDDHWNRDEPSWVLMYDFNLACRSLSLSEGVPLEEAVEWLSYNAVGAWIGTGTPTFVFREEC